ncbi:plant invertase/pectin methylesterase inhibitor [Striga asiatica]|uniref:Plant invertase/pectin methylesterase inhibitor n=1 Tax=Striga asiatica TaxID=4170 RepID=A0A5A7PF92_STRAF|nr:plant invertase/pectin methylesterase inhibitor [Striga asiatica]
MAQTPPNLTFFLLLSLLILTLVRADHTVVHHRSRARAFIEFQCRRATLYPDLCVRTLSFYAHSLSIPPSHKQLAQFALRVTLARAQSTRAYVTQVANGLNWAKARDYQSIRQCLDQINDGVDQLTNCIKETQKIRDDMVGTRDFSWRESNVKTWMSTALTDTSMCVDGFSGQAIGGKTKAIIKAKVLNLQQVTSNALALFNRFAARYKAAHM